MKNFISLTATCYILLSSPAYAYIDMGTAGIILQAIIGGAVAAMAVLANYWHSVKAFFARLFNRKDNNQQEEQQKDGQDQ